MSDLKSPCPICGQIAVLHTDMGFTPDGGANGYMTTWCCYKCNIDVIVRTEIDEEEADCIEKAQAFFNGPRFIQAVSFPPPGVPVSPPENECITCRLKDNGCGPFTCEHGESYEPWHCCETCGRTCRDIKRYGINSLLSMKKHEIPITTCFMWISPSKIKNKTTPSRQEGMRGACLHQALDIINGERQDSYGKPEDSFQIIADFWGTYLHHRGSDPITPMDVARMMSLMKHARMLGQADKEDNYIDAAGYLGIASDMWKINKED